MRRTDWTVLALLGMVWPGLTVAQGKAPANVIAWLVKNKCEQVSSDRRYRLLGSLVERDDVDKEEFGFVICQRWNLNSGDWDVIIQSNRAVGAGLTSVEAQRKAGIAAAAGQGYLKFGLPFNPLGKLDHRRVEYRLHQEKARPAALEVFVVMRDAARVAKKPRSVRIAWPRPPM